MNVSLQSKGFMSNSNDCMQNQTARKVVKFLYVVDISKQV